MKHNDCDVYSYIIFDCIWNSDFVEHLYVFVRMCAGAIQLNAYKGQGAMPWDKYAHRRLIHVGIIENSDCCREYEIVVPHRNEHTNASQLVVLCQLWILN